MVVRSSSSCHKGDKSKTPSRMFGIVRLPKFERVLGKSHAFSKRSRGECSLCETRKPSRSSR